MTDFEEELEYFSASRKSHVMVLSSEATSDAGGRVAGIGIQVQVDNITHARPIPDRELYDFILEPILSTESVCCIR